MNLIGFSTRHKRLPSRIGPQICSAVCAITLVGEGAGASTASAAFNFKGGVFAQKPAMSFAVDTATDVSANPINVTIQLDSWVMNGTKYSGAKVIAIATSPTGITVASYTVSGALTFIGNGARLTTTVAP